MLGLVLLRVTVGWHFLYSGIWKVEQTNFSAAGFLSQAKGPLANYFHSMVPDIDGRQALDFERQMTAMKDYTEAFANQNRFDKEQRALADEILQARQNDLQDFLADDVKKKTPDGKNWQLKEQFADHLHQLDRLAANKEADTRDIPFVQKRNWDEQQKLRGQAAAWNKSIDEIWKGLKSELADIADRQPPEQPRYLAPNLEQIDHLITYSNIAIGACLIVGLFTRFSALCGVLFLAQVVAAQPDWPGLYPIPHPSAGRSLIVNKEFVEMMALVALAMLPVGRWAGLDFFVHNLLVRPLMGKKGAV